MILTTLGQPGYKAREKYLEYLQAEKQSHDKRITFIKNAYREICRGSTVIDLLETLGRGGLDHVGRPKLACCAATAKRCGLDRAWNNGQWFVHFIADDTISRRKGDRVEIPIGCFPGNVTDKRYSAIVPSVPPKLIPKKGLKDLYILWEAEWQGVPVDPALLKHLGGPFYSVLAVWDLTPVERAALRL